MKIVIFFAPNFCDWPIEVIRLMMQKEPNLEIIGLAMDEHVYKRISAYKDIPIIELHNLDDIEKQSITQEVSDEQFEQLEDTIGADVLSKTVIADKNLASGWVDGAILYDTSLAAKARDQLALKSYIYGFYNFLFDLYERHNPDLAFIYTIASGVTYAIGAAALHHGFPFVRFQHSRIQKFFVLDTTLDGLLEPVMQELEKAAKDKNHLSEFYEPAQQHLDNCRNKTRDTSNLALNKKMYSKAMQWPSMVRETLATIWRFCKKQAIKDRLPLRERPERLNFMFKVSSAFKRRYLNMGKYCKPFAPYKDKQYAYFALHVDPEASTLICAPYHANQTAVIEALSKNMPLSSVLLVKEHPIMIGKRPKDFYKKIAQMPNVVLVDHEEDSHELIKHASLVVTITGTVGWEALLHQKPLLLLARTPYLTIKEGIVFCQDFAKLHEAIKKALKTPPASDEALVQYLAAVMKASLHMPDELLWGYSKQVFEKHKDTSEELASRLLEFKSSSKGNVERLHHGSSNHG
ncbi:MAG: hypothetical protein MRY79_00170 [Alphaproteobacteria bacterium]|nr:hypothetical protein [Alphaproteobacteria bacterium]